MTATLQVRIDEAERAEADALFASLGLDTPTAVRIFLAAARRAGGFPFPVRREPNATTRRALAAALDDQGISGPFDSADEMIADILARD